MGSAQSLLTPQNFVAATILVVVVASTWYNRVKVASSTLTGESTFAGKKGKKKRTARGDTLSESWVKEKDSSLSSLTNVSSSALSERSIPGGILESTQPEVSKPVKDRKRKAKKSAKPLSSKANNESLPVTGSTPNPASTSTARPQTQKRVSMNNDEEPWTRVESRRRSSGQNAASSDAGITTSSATDGSSSGVLEKSENRGTPRPQKTLAEKMIPKGRKTAVDDMLESSQYPELSRVMRMPSGENELSASGFSSGGYENVEDARGVDADGEDDGGWGVVKSRGKAKHNQPFPSPAVAPQPKASETLTKKQRQNAAKREAAKVAKTNAEAERLAQLAMHKRELERVRIGDQYSHKGGHGPRSNVSGGMSATVNEKGQLVWN